MVGGAAGDDDDPPQRAQLVLGHAEPLEHERAVADAVADRLAEALGLLVDLLLHERLVAGALGDLLVPVDLDRLERDRAAVARPRPRCTDVGRDLDDLAVAGVLDAARLGEERAQVGGEEVLVAAEADDERRLAAHPDERSGVVVVDDDEGEVALEPAVDGAHGRDEVALVDALDQVGDDLGVGLGAEPVAVGLELGLELAVVLDDAVEHDREPRVVAAGERVGVVLGDPAVGRPARVAEARRSRREPLGPDDLLELARGCRRRGRSRARRPREARCRPSRSRGTRAARDPRAGDPWRGASRRSR